MGSFFGKICTKHPELNGKRFESNKKCVQCCYERNSKFRKTDSQKERIKNYQRKYELKGGPGYEAKKERNKRWFDNNKNWFKQRNLKRRELGGNFVGHNDALKNFYANCPDGCHVDHIVPLKGMSKSDKQHVVCGLHVPWNLQYLKGEDNDRKWAWF